METIKIKHPKFIELDDDECLNCYAYVHDYENLIFVVMNVVMNLKKVKENLKNTLSI